MVPRIATIEPVELVPSVDVDALIADAHDEFSRLEDRAAEASAAADQAEARARAQSIDPASAPKAMAKMQQFIAQWRGDVDAEAERIVEAARAGARIRVDEAKAEVDRIRRARLLDTQTDQRSAPVVDELRVPAVAPPPPVFTPVAGPQFLDVPNLPQAPGIDDGIADADAESAALFSRDDAVAPEMSVLPAVVDQTGSQSPVVGHDATMAPPVTPDEPVAPDAVAPQAAPVPAIAAAVTPAPDTLVADAPVPDAPAPEAGFWAVTEEAPKKRRRFLGRIPLSAVFEVLAVLLILVFILLRLS
jgi:hypothetical protein